MINLPEQHRLHQCAICEMVDVWSDEWSAYGSLALEDYDSSLVPRLCSSACKDTFNKRLTAGKIRVPTAVIRGYETKITGKAVGYKRQPSADVLRGLVVNLETP